MDNGGAWGSLQKYKLDGVHDTHKEIGKGSYASVVEMKFRGLICAGKKLRVDVFNNGSPTKKEGMLQRMEIECKLLATVRHPCIVQFLGVNLDQSSDLPTLLMEYLPTTLSACLNQYGNNLPQEITYTMLEDVALGLCYLHGSEPAIIHRDLTANNVLLTSDMRAKIADLGVAKILDYTPQQRTETATCPGTASYMPQELLVSHPSYHRSIDCFSFGILMVHIFCGEWPLPGAAHRPDPNHPDDTARVILISEVDRRKKYLDMIGKNHSLMKLIEDCLKKAEERPDADEILECVKREATQLNFAPHNRLALLQQRNDEIKEKQRLLGVLHEKKEELERSKLDHSTDLETKIIEISELTSENSQLRQSVEVKSMQIETSAKAMEAKEKEVELKDELLKTKEQQLVAHKELLIEKTREVEVLNARITENDSISHSKLHQAQYQNKCLKSYLTSGTQFHLMHPETPLTWDTYGDLPIGMTAPQCTVIGPSLYVGGGQTGDDLNLRKIYRFVIPEKTWDRSLPECPTAFFGLGQLSGSVVAVGGLYQGGLMTEKVYVLEQPVQNDDGGKVSERAALPLRWNGDVVQKMNSPRTRVCVVSHDTCMAACGGISPSRSSTTDVEVYQSENNQWHLVSPLPISHAALRMTVLRDTIYFFGGFNDMRNESTLHCIYITTESLFQTDTTAARKWNQLPDVVCNSSTPGCIAGSLLSLGGKFGEQHTDKIHAFVPSTGQWIDIAKLPIKISSATAVTLDSGELILLGGWTNLGKGKRNTTVFTGSLKFPDSF